ncbi:jg19057 [Pararge aegeria aegeria]|uniref:Jg19057 protein n=1 Tax=Pararge aegeria aegeria TaxID=348720 RepID=A0A8S4SNP3_9NEOP|nr:jg19057 [Pararge aegeria aegeria]
MSIRDENYVLYSLYVVKIEAVFEPNIGTSSTWEQVTWYVGLVSWAENNWKDVTSFMSACRTYSKCVNVRASERVREGHAGGCKVNWSNCRGEDAPQPPCCRLSASHASQEYALCMCVSAASHGDLLVAPPWDAPHACRRLTRGVPRRAPMPSSSSNATGYWIQ